ncbi:hypothetical protein BDC45DRAFT_559718 [Circinella umbellata]|nr:hypothetical protein BDC45DRAFT_559718 [Circinella umbellata]
MASDVFWRLCKPVDDDSWESMGHPTHPAIFSLIHTIDEERQLIVIEVVDDLVAKFEDFSLSQTQVHRHMKTTCNLSVSIARFESEKRNSFQNLEERYKWFMDWKGSNGEALLVGTHLVVKVPVTRVVTYTVLGAITGDTVIHLSLRKPALPKPKPKEAKTNKRKKKDVKAEATVEEKQENEYVEQY